MMCFTTPGWLVVSDIRINSFSASPIPGSRMFGARTRVSTTSQTCVSFCSIKLPGWGCRYLFLLDAPKLYWLKGLPEVQERMMNGILDQTDGEEKFPPLCRLADVSNPTVQCEAVIYRVHAQEPHGHKSKDTVKKLWVSLQSCIVPFIAVLGHRLNTPTRASAMTGVIFYKNH